MTRMINWTGTAAIKIPLVLLICLLAVSIFPASAQSEIETRETGRELYIRYGCYSCHGYEAQGGGHGPSLTLRPLPKEAFLTIVRRPYGVMPAYSPKYLGETELEQIYEYVRTIPESQRPEDIRKTDHAEH